MNPYRELGVQPTASIDEIEARYRLLMREHHPDFHQDEGAEALAEAERRTRNLNAAMDRIRQDRDAEGETPAWTWDDSTADDPSDGAGTDDRDDDRRRGPWAGDNPFWRPPGDDRETRVNNDTRARDWFGNAIPTDEPVPCPFCRKPFDRLAEYEQHLKDVHRFRDGSVGRSRRPSRASGLVRVIGALRFIPAWLVALVAIAFWVMFNFYWFVGALAFLALVLWTQTSPRFRNR
jgi:hypothetical protein